MTKKKQPLLADIESTWQAFMSTGTIKAGALRPEIADSWKRCRGLGIDPYDGSSPTVLSEREFAALLSRKKNLIGIAVPFMQRLYELIRDSGFAVVLTDEQGFILEIVRTPDLEEAIMQTHVNYLPGSRWLEQDVGTNGIDMVLRYKKPYQMSGAEHYANTHHVVACIGAPIFNADGELAGTLTASGYAHLTQKHTAAMMVAAVEVITDEIMLREKNRELTITNNRLANVLMSMSDGVIVTDHHGVIQQVNPVAQKMLGQSVRLGSHTLSDFYADSALYLDDVLGKGKSYIDREVAVKSTHILATANPIRDEQEQIVGGIIVLTPAAKLQKLIKRYASTSPRFHFKDIIGRSPAMRAALDLAERASKKSNTILLEGESGSGKEIFAQAIHNHSERRNGPFVAINCGALPRELISSELFGYMEGTFTGAKKEGRPGKFELANGGTIFLDEVAEMPLEQQVNLLRVLQERTVTRIGSIKEIPIDVMIICATNKNLQLEVMRTNFRQDLYYRLNVIAIKIPPLRERLEDIPQLVDFFIASMSGTRSRIRVTPEVIACFSRYHWPGNVRELQNVIEKMLLYCDGDTLGLECLPAGMPLPPAPLASEQNLPGAHPDFLQSARKRRMDKVQEEERQRLLLLLSQYGGNISAMAHALGVNRCTIYRQMKRYHITGADDQP